MQVFTRMITLSYLALVGLMIAVKAFVPLPDAVGYAPFPLELGPASQPLELVVWHDAAAQAWFEAAARTFEASKATIAGRPIQVRLVALGSPELVQRIEQQDWGAMPQPHVVSPASSVWLDLLRNNVGSPLREGADAPTPLAFSPLVAVAWEERANLLWPNGLRTFWDDLYAALAHPAGWAGVAAANGISATSPVAQQANEWGLVKVGHAAPLQAHSGMQTLILMAYAYHDKRADLSVADIQDPGFQAWAQTIQSAVRNTDTGTDALMEQMVRFGPSRYDLVLVPEHTAVDQLLAAQSRWGQQIRIYYPPETLVSDHPYAILDAPFTDNAEHAAARAFRTFLLARPMQELALQSGFRPADLGVPMVSSDPNQPFNRYAPFGMRVEFGQQVEPPSAAVIQALIDFQQQALQP